ncbi:hypothetical protein BGZ93_006620 [Podila epicladia]|nr:hypothetical protein BGZ93_006620 [Podila epicladia]
MGQDRLVCGMVGDYYKNLYKCLAGVGGVIGQAVSGLKSLIANSEGMAHDITDEFNILSFLGYAIEFDAPLIRVKEPPFPPFDGMTDELIKIIQAGIREISQGTVSAVATLTATLKTFTTPLMLL